MNEKFVDFPLSESNHAFSIDLAGTSDCSNGYTVYREKARETAVIYIFQGEGTIFLDQRAYSAGAGDTVILPAGRKHYYYSNDKDPWQIIWYNAVGSLPSCLLDEYNPKSMVVFPGYDSSGYIRRVHALADEPGLTAARKHQKAALLFHEMLQGLNSRFYEEKLPSSSATEAVRNYLDNHFREPVRLSQLCPLTYLSQSQLIRTFKRDTGKTPYEYCLALKLRQAEKLLTGTSLRVKEISASLGFCDEHYFSCIFKKKTGKTPLEYRKSFHTSPGTVL